jgi:uncharacterized protein YdeI (YjbR/CyaY-like superfamily)
VDDVETIACTDADEWDRWLAEHGTTRPAVWLRIAKKGGTGIGSTDAGDVAICHGWIDGQRRSLDETHFLQRYSPRRPGSPWSLVNVRRMEALAAAGRMRPGGLAQVDAARADGRWEAAYAPQRSATVPAELTAALAANPRARGAFEALSRTDRYVLFLPLLKARTAASRDAVVARIVETLDPTPGS